MTSKGEGRELCFPDGEHVKQMSLGSFRVHLALG